MKITISFDENDMTLRQAMGLALSAEHCNNSSQFYAYDKNQDHGIIKRTTRKGNVMYDVHKNKLKDVQK